MTTPTPGATCRLSRAKSATVWEIQTVNHEKNSVYLSKLGGDGFVNKSAYVEDLLDLEPQKLDVALYEVLDIKKQIEFYSASIKDKARFINQAEDVHHMASNLMHLAVRYRDANAMYWHGIETHYPHLDNRRK